MFIRAFFVVLLLCTFANDVEATVPLAEHYNIVNEYVPRFDVPKDQRSVVTVDEPESAQAFYGELNHFPHTYEIVSTDKFNLHAEILVPDIDSSENIISGIIVKKQENGGGVTEVARLNAEDASWERYKNTEFDEWYRIGPRFEDLVDAGTYKVEVHTPDNIGKYVLVVGTNDDIEVGYFEYLGKMIDVKRFSERSPLLIVLSPYVYLPLIIIVWGIWYYHRRKNRASQDDILEA